jgi:catechol 2,3-dioxygenase-like lactoylglutathione lyase family enzyme
VGRNAFSHLFIHVSSLPASRAFYVDRLGLEVLMEEPGYLRVGGGEGFHIGLEERPPAEVGGTGIEIVVRVGDVDVMASSLRDAGLEITDPEDQPWGDRHAWTNDPDGYRISIYSTRGGDR